jgi:RimJ/RimL family protein N-acetyltransferase
MSTSTPHPKPHPAGSQRWIPPAILEGQRVRLEPLDICHAPHLLAAFDAELFRHMVSGPPESTRSGFERDIEWMRSFPNDVPYAIVLRDTGRAIGRTAFREINPPRRGLEIGRTWIGREWHGKGVNPEAKYLMLRHVFEHASPHAQRVALWTNATNLHSQRAIAGIGAVREGVLRRFAADPSRPELPPKDIVLYSIIAEEWPMVKAHLEARIRAGK